MARGKNRIRALAGAAINALRKPSLDVRPADPRKILVLHELLLGDTLMLAPLLAALRAQYPHAQVFVTAHSTYANLFRGKPYGVTVLPYSERDANSLGALEPAKDCDIAILPGENRHAIAARAIGARWIVGFAGGKPAWRDRTVDELVAFPSVPMGLADMFALLAGIPTGPQDGLLYDGNDWPAPAFAPFDIPPRPYAVLHVGAGSPLRRWEPGKWRAVANALALKDLHVVWTSGKDETELVRSIDPEGRYLSLAGQLDLPQLWHLLAEAHCAVTLDTGIAHMAKLTSTPVVAIYGPGSAVLFGKGSFWGKNDFSEITVSDFPCRDQRHLFKRDVPWVRRCNRTSADCPRARCMDAIESEQVLAALQVE